jgi:hypothetical protein
MGLKHLESDEECQQATGNAKIIQSNVKECQDLLTE